VSLTIRVSFGESACAIGVFSPHWFIDFDQLFLLLEKNSTAIFVPRWGQNALKIKHPHVFIRRENIEGNIC